MGLNKSPKNSFAFNTSLIWLVLVVLINLYMMLTVIYTTYSFSTPFIVAFPWLLAALMSKDKKAWIRAIVICVLGLIIHIAIWFYDLFIITSIEDFYEQESAMHVTIWIREIFWMILIIYAFRICKEVTEKIAVTKGGKNKSMKAVNVETIKKDKHKSAVVREETKPKPIVQTDNISKKEIIVEKNNLLKTDKLDINTCSENEFMELPGMSLLSAKKAVENRDKNGDYQSVDDFVARNEIKPHFMVQMEDRIIVVKKEDKKAMESAKRARTLDL